MLEGQANVPLLFQSSAVPRNSAAYQFCVMSDKQGGNAALFGVSALEDATEVYQQVFDLSDNHYHILTMCVLEVSSESPIPPQTRSKGEAISISRHHSQGFKSS